MTADDHGSYSTYINYRCRCEACRRACSETQRSARQRRGSALTDDSPLHGRYSTYTNYGCRCRPCTDAVAARMRDYRRKARA